MKTSFNWMTRVFLLFFFFTFLHHPPQICPLSLSPQRLKESSVLRLCLVYIITDPNCEIKCRATARSVIAFFFFIVAPLMHSGNTLYFTSEEEEAGKFSPSLLSGLQAVFMLMLLFV